MTDWAKVLEHKEANLTLLCDSHNRQKKDGLLTEEQVREADADPWCRRNGYTAPFGLNFSSTSDIATFKVGTDYFQSGGDMVVFAIDNAPLVGFRRADDGLFLRMYLQDEHNRPALNIPGADIQTDGNLWRCPVVFSIGLCPDFPSSTPVVDRDLHA